MNSIAKFWNKVERGGEDECWMWKGKPNEGYGRFGQVKAHRVAFELFHHRKAGKELCHSCENKLCVNPHHLYEGNQVTNMRDLYVGGGGRRKLSNEDVKEIRRLAKMGRYRQRELAERFGCSQPNISRVLSGWYYVHH